jgi:hypothetical protein
MKPNSPPSAKLPPIVVTRINPIESVGGLLAFVSVNIGVGKNSIQLHKIRIAKPRGERQRFEVVFPQESWLSNGERRYTTLIRLPKAWMLRLQKAVIQAWNEYQHSGMLPQIAQEVSK